MANKAIPVEVLNVKTRLLNSGLTQVDLVAIMYGRGMHKSLPSLKVQVNYLMNGKRYNDTSKKILAEMISVLDDIDAKRINPYTSREVELE